MSWRCAWVGFALSLLVPCAHAQWKPDKNVEIVVPSAPGGSNDKTARGIERIIHDKRLLTARSSAAG